MNQQNPSVGSTGSPQVISGQANNQGGKPFDDAQGKQQIQIKASDAVLKEEYSNVANQ